MYPQVSWEISLTVTSELLSGTPQSICTGIISKIYPTVICGIW